jgi:4-amino-4-deoxy-L-arabinose transferase-like glycosyltransferase
LLILTACILIPFLDKAFHIDDPLFIWTAQHITRNPFDFYGFEINWYGSAAPISTIAKNPPLFSYYLAGWGSVFGWSEVSLHLAGLIPSLLVAWGTFELARLWRAVPAFAALAAICTPVFVMSGTSVMCDMLMVAFWVWAVYFWARGLEEQRRGFLALAAVCVIGSGLTKYFGISLIPLLVVYALMKRVPFACWRPWLLLAVAGFVAYELWTQYLYGAKARVRL